MKSRGESATVSADCEATSPAAGQEVLQSALQAADQLPEFHRLFYLANWPASLWQPMIHAVRFAAFDRQTVCKLAAIPQSAD